MSSNVPPPGLIHVRFDLAVSPRDRNKDQFIMRANLPQVPSVNETVNLQDDPYLVIDRGWAVAEDGALYAYLRVVRYA